MLGIIWGRCQHFTNFVPFAQTYLHRDSIKGLLSSSQNTDLMGNCSLFYKVGGGKEISQRARGSALSFLYIGKWILLSNLIHSICPSESFDSCRQIWEFHIQGHKRLSCCLLWLNMMNKEHHKTLENIVKVRKIQV